MNALVTIPTHEELLEGAQIGHNLLCSCGDPFCPDRVAYVDVIDQVIVGSMSFDDLQSAFEAYAKHFILGAAENYIVEWVKTQAL